MYLNLKLKGHAAEAEWTNGAGLTVTAERRDHRVQYLNLGETVHVCTVSQ